LAGHVADLSVGLVLQTGTFFTALSGALDSAASKLTAWGMRTSLLISAPLAGIAGVVGRVAVDFDKEMRNVNATLLLSEDEFRNLRQEVLDLSLTTRASSADVARSLLMIVHAGTSAEDTMELLSVASHAAGAGLTTTAETTRLLIAVMRAYKLSVADAQSVIDKFIFASQHGAGTFAELTHTLGAVIPAAAMAGMSIEEVNASMAVLRSAGLNAAEASVSLRAAIRRILDPTEEMAKVFEAAGYESGLAALQALGFDGVIRLIARASGESADKIIKMAGDIRAWRAIIPLAADDAQELSRNIAYFGESAEGAMERARVQQYKSFSAQVSRLKSALEVLGISLAEVVLPGLTALVKALVPIVRGFADMSDATKKWIVALVGVGVALGPTLLFLGKILSLGSLIVSVALNPLTLALLAVAYAAYRWVTARYHIETLADAVLAFSDLASQALDWVAERMIGLTDVIGKMAQWGAEAIGAFAQGIIDGLGYVVQAIHYVAQAIAGLLAPGSPPVVLPEIVQWGQSAIDEFLRGMTMADFSILDDVGDKIAEHLSTLDFGGEAGLSEALIKARVALARVIEEASVSGEASAEAWQDLREAIHDDTGEIERYLRLRIEAARVDSSLAQAEMARKKATRDLEEESLRIQVRQKEEIRVADERVKAAEEALQDFREQSAEIPERFTRGRKRQLEAELRAAQKERESIKGRQEIEREQFEIRRRHVKDELDAQVAAAQAKRNLAKEEADWLESVIAQKQKIVGLYKEEKGGVAELGLDLGELTPEALAFDESLGGIAESVGKIGEETKKVFGIWRAFWMGLTGAEMDEQLKDMTAEERGMFSAGKRLHDSFMKVVDAIKQVGEALEPLGEKLGSLGGEGVVAGGLAGLFGAGLLLKLGPTLIRFGIGIGGLIIQGIVGAISGGVGGIGGLVGGLEGIWSFLFAGATGAGELGLAIGVLAAIIAALISTLRFLWVYGKESLWDLFEGAKGFVDEFLASIDTSRWGPVIDGLAKLWNVLVIVFKLVGGILGTVVMAAFQMLGAALPFVGALLADFINLLGSLASFIMTAVIGPLDILWTLFAEGPAAAWEKVKFYMEQGIEAILDILGSLSSMGVDLVTGFCASFVGLISGAAEGVLGIIEDLFGDATTIFGVKLDEIRIGIRQFKDDIVASFIGLRDDVVAWISSLTDEAIALFGSLKETLIGGSVIPEMIGQIETAFGKMEQGVVATSTGMMQGVVSGITGGVPTLQGALAGVAVGAPTAVGSVGGAVQLQITNYWDASISAKDRAELAAQMENTVYGALGKVYGGAA